MWSEVLLSLSIQFQDCRKYQEMGLRTRRAGQGSRRADYCLKWDSTATAPQNDLQWAVHGQIFHQTARNAVHGALMSCSHSLAPCSLTGLHQRYACSGHYWPTVNPGLLDDVPSGPAEGHQEVTASSWSCFHLYQTRRIHSGFCFLTGHTGIPEV